MERQLIEGCLKLENSRGYATIRNQHLGKQVDLEVLTNNGVIEVSGSLIYLSYPSYVTLELTDKKIIKRLFSHPNLSKEYFKVRYLEGLELKSLDQNQFTIRAEFLTFLHAIKSLTLDKTVLYNNLFIENTPNYFLFEGNLDQRFEEVNTLREKLGFPKKINF